MIGRLFKRKSKVGTQPQRGARRTWPRRHFGVDRIIGLSLVGLFVWLSFWNVYGGDKVGH